MHYEVCDCPVDSVHGVASRHEYPTLNAAWVALVTRVQDEYKDHCSEAYGVDDETGEPMCPKVAEPEFVAAVEASLVAFNDVMPDGTYRGVRYWIEAHEFVREGGCRG